MINSLLIVCVGNICRSPAVEKLFNQRLRPAITVSSAGLGALVGHSIDPKMQLCLEEHGVHDLAHSARQFTREMAQQADLVLVMEPEHLDTIRQMVPEAAGKTMLLGKWDNGKPVEDPYRRSKEFFNLVYFQMSRYVQQWSDKIG